MNRFRHSVFARSFLLPLALLLWLSACASYKQIGPGEIGDHGTVRLTLHDGSRHILKEPEAEGDRITGRLRERDRTFSVPIDSIAKAEAEYINAETTVGFTILLVGGVAFLIWAPSACLLFCSD